MENEFTFENPEYRKTYWHTCSHIMAQAVKRLWPEVQLAIGPAIDEGWYYDFDAPFTFTPEHLAKIEAEMEKKFSSLMTASNVKVGGVDFVADVMNNLDRSSEKNIFDRLAEYNEPLADEIRKRMFVFEDIVTMDDRSVQRFVRDCDPRDLVLALKGANSDVANKIFTNMSARMAQSIREDLEITSNVRIRDVEEAQQRIVGIIRDLEERSELIILKGGKDDIIA